MNCDRCGSPVFPGAGTTPHEIVSALARILGDIEVSATSLQTIQLARDGQAIITAAVLAEQRRPVVEVSGP
jgi:hypothetical membrane protein